MLNDHDVVSALADLEKNQIISRIWSGDHTVWKPDHTEITDRLERCKQAKRASRKIGTPSLLVMSVRVSRRR